MYITMQTSTENWLERELVSSFFLIRHKVNNNYNSRGAWLDRWRVWSARGEGPRLRLPERVILL